jgi:hypothetical protein
MAWTNITDFVAHTEATAAKLNQVRDNENFLKENIELETADELTIDTGAVTIAKSYHTVDTEGDAASDDLENIGGGSEGRILILRAADNARMVVLKDSVGNLILGGADIYLDGIGIHVVLICDSSGKWILLAQSPSSYY